jgi:AraC-like DNA-binding protein
LDEVLRHRLVDSIVLGPWTARRPEAPSLASRFPTIPRFVAGSIRPEDADSILQWAEIGVSEVFVEGVDDAVVGEKVARGGAAARRLPLRADLVRLLRLTEPLQRAAWDRIAPSPGRPPRPAQVARALGVSREHLSRQFGAGGAPNLKRVSDLLTVQVALELLDNPGYDRRTAARLLGFAGPSHLGTTVRRLTGLGLADARRLEWRDLVRRFLRQGGR